MHCENLILQQSPMQMHNSECREIRENTVNEWVFEAERGITSHQQIPVCCLY